MLLFKSTATLQLDEESTVEAVSSHKSHKIEVRASFEELGRGLGVERRVC